jgi:oxygen-independent coproporphyrinogen III oxidase
MSFVWPVPRSLYVHIPFCVRRCGYCNFSVIAGRRDLHDRLLAALDRELASATDGLAPPLDTIFIGGGTPTELSDDRLEQLLKSLGRRFRIATDAEITMEVNPENVSVVRARRWSQMGINRISLGVQSFRDEKLHVLQRGHSGVAAIAAVQTVAGVIPNVSIDLIFAAPGESIAHWQSDLLQAMSLPIKHLSTYALTFEKGTTFWNRREVGGLTASLEEDELAMYQLTRQMTRDRGWHHYEVSSFERDGHACRHNQAYWKGQGWYAVGPGAARFVNGSRDLNHRSPTTYLQRCESGQDPTTEREPLSTLQYIQERLAFGIRMIDGIDIDKIMGEVGIDVWPIAQAAIEVAIRDGNVDWTPPILKLTHRGVLFADTVAAQFLEVG